MIPQTIFPTITLCTDWVTNKQHQNREQEIHQEIQQHASVDEMNHAALHDESVSVDATTTH